MQVPHTNISTEERLSLSDFRQRVQSKVIYGDPQSMMNVAEDLVALSNNKELIGRLFSRELSNWKSGQFSMYSPQSCVVDSFGEYVVRLNFWPLLPSDPRRREALARLLSYDDCHDHNFSFITTNFFGPGYTTIVHSYDYAKAKGLVGEQVDMTYLGSFDLAPGDVMLFESGKHLHRQLPPTAASASLNLMMAPATAVRQEQFYFDPEERRIVGYVSSTSTKRNSQLNFIPELMNHQTVDLLRKIAESHSSLRLRREAKRMLDIVDR